MELTVPVSCQATVYVPAPEQSDVTESRQPARRARGVNFLEMKEGYALYEVGSGKYQF